MCSWCLLWSRSSYLERSRGSGKALSPLDLQGKVFALPTPDLRPVKGHGNGRPWLQLGGRQVDQVNAEACIVRRRVLDRLLSSDQFDRRGTGDNGNRFHFRPPILRASTTCDRPVRPAGSLPRVPNCRPGSWESLVGGVPANLSRWGPRRPRRPRSGRRA